LPEEAVTKLRTKNRHDGYSLLKKSDRELDRLISKWEKENRLLYSDPGVKDAKATMKDLKKSKIEKGPLTDKQKAELKEAKKIYKEYKIEIDKSTQQVRAAINFSKTYKAFLDKHKKVPNRVKNRASQKEVDACASDLKRKIMTAFQATFLS
jgi:hypothetical protein